MLKMSRIKINKKHLNLFLDKIWEKSQNFSIIAFTVFEIFRKNQLGINFPPRSNRVKNRLGRVFRNSFNFRNFKIYIEK